MGRKAFYTDIQDYIIKGIISGEFKPGGRIPTGHILAQKFGCSRPCVSAACHDLQSRGFLFSNKHDRSKGTFVSQDLVVQHVQEIKKPKEKTIKQEIVQPKTVTQLGFSVTPLADGGLKFQFSNS